MQTEQSHTILRQAEDSFRQADYDQALTVLVRGFATDMEYRPFYTLAAQTLELMKAKDEAQLFWDALEHFEDWEPFYKLGYHFVDLWQYEMAKPFLEKSYKLDPTNPDGVHELALCYANTFELPKAVQLLEGFEYHDFWTVYRLHRYWLLTNTVAPIPEYISESLKKLDKLERDEEAIPQAYNLLNELHIMFHRYQLQPKEYIHPLQFWHFVQYGTALIDIAADNGQDGTGGRYLAYEASYSTVATMLHHMVDYLKMIDFQVQKVVFLENPDDAVLGIALAKILEVPAEVVDGGNLLHSHTVIVAADNKTFNGEHDLWDTQEHQMVFAFCVDWLQPSMICPDIIGVLSKSCRFPWKEQLTAESSNWQALASKVVRELPVVSTQPWLKFYSSVASYLLGGKEGYKQRPTFRVESPIAGVYL